MSPHNDEKVDKAEFLAEQLALGLGEVKKIVENLRTDLQAERMDKVDLKSEIKHLSANVEKLNKIVLDVHSSESFIARLITLEKNAKQDNDAKNEEKKEETKGKWQFRIVLITSSVGLILGIVTAILTFFK